MCMSEREIQACLGFEDFFSYFVSALNKQFAHLFEKILVCDHTQMFLGISASEHNGV